MRTTGTRRSQVLRFSRRELGDLLVAWTALGIAFTIFLNPQVLEGLLAGAVGARAVLRLFALSMLTVGTGFLLHELAHKIVAVRFGQTAEFRADYSMLGLAVLAALAGFLFAAPGAVYHRGRVTRRENGLIALAGPLTNVGLAGLFALASLGPGFLGAVGNLGVFINVLLAAFNMIPFGPLDGRTVLAWSPLAYAAAFLVTVGPGIVLLYSMFA
jgi:Zn-dependent protease